MTNIREDPVRYWSEAAAAHREHVKHVCVTAAHKKLHEDMAVECDRKAAVAAATHAFDGGPK